MQSQLTQPLLITLAATLKGRCANGNERDHGAVVHAVAAANADQFGIHDYSRALCGKTHGPLSAGWSIIDAAVTCPQCLKEMQT